MGELIFPHLYKIHVNHLKDLVLIDLTVFNIRGYPEPASSNKMETLQPIFKTQFLPVSPDELIMMLSAGSKAVTTAYQSFRSVFRERSMMEIGLTDTFIMHAQVLFSSEGKDAFFVSDLVGDTDVEEELSLHVFIQIAQGTITAVLLTA